MQVKATSERMVAAVDGQNMSNTACQPSGYTEPLLHAWWLKVKASQ